MTTITFKLDDHSKKQSAMDQLSDLQDVFKVVCNDNDGIIKTYTGIAPERVLEEAQRIDGISDVMVHSRCDR